jgi:hypothetical protein
MPKSSLLLSLLALILFTSPLQALNVTYIGGFFGNWHQNSSWSTGSPPTVNDRVIINCDCYVLLTANAPGFAASIEIGPDAILYVYTGASLEVQPVTAEAVLVQGTLYNRGTTTIENPNFTTFVGIKVESGGSVNNQENLRAYNATHGIRNYGQVQNTGSLRIGSTAYGTNQTNGIVNFSNSLFINHGSTGSETRIFATQNYGFLSLSNSTINNYGLLRIESSVVDRGITNLGNFNNTGNIQLRGGTTIGLRNEGSLTNSGLIYAYNSGSGTAIGNAFGSLINTSSGLIKVWGFSYDTGFEAVGGTYEIVNHGTFDIFTGVSNSYNAVYFHTNTRFRNTGLFKVVTYADHAFVFNGDLFDNAGGTVDINVYGPHIGLSIRNNAEFLNRQCGTLLLEDRLEVYGTGLLNNEAWMEFEIYAGSPIMQPGATIKNSGVIQDLYGSLANVAFDNDQGVLVIPITNIIYPGIPYLEPFMVGQGTEVIVSSDIYGGAPNNVMGTYDQAQNVMVMDPALFSYEKYYYADFTIPGCGTRNYAMYRESPQPFAPNLPGNTAAITNGGTELAGQVEVFPNPVLAQLNITLPAQWRGTVDLQLRSVTGQTVLRESRDAAAGRISLNRPASLPAGVYVLTARDAAGNQTDKKVIFGEQR